ncbi:MAG: FAD-dependent thymidylate synthase, partial [Chloroflexi bacterium]|nr:FAD-dependent thymidylate synthase [Chloroflexota bacterium]
LYTRTCDHLFETYHLLLEGTQAHLRRVQARQEGERDGAYNLRIRREATDTCRFILPAATLTNVGVTINARSMEHAIRKLLSSDLQEEREIGELLKQEGRRITPTLIKYAEPSTFLAKTRKAGRNLQSNTGNPVLEGASRVQLLHYDREAEEKVVTAFLYLFSQEPYPLVWQRVKAMSTEGRAHILEEALSNLGPFDAPGREMEMPDYTFEFVLDYGAYREFKRHRMQSYLPQPLTVAHGYIVPPLVVQAGLEEQFRSAMGVVADAFDRVASRTSLVAQYLVTHAHLRRVIAKLNLRECYHLFKLRTGPQAHFTLREVMQQALTRCTEVHPTLFRYLQHRDR